ncbi:AAA family ATPase [Nocardia abscessus]|uniref:AAA family ATPase n=1 Tax=Nocardia abscessus TaxID=120957 RepID=UPI002456801F|nr:ATP-binding protein [Nocardia abscessus]
MNAALNSRGGTLIVVLRGLMGAGKSTLATQLASSTPTTAIVCRDTVRSKHFYRHGRLSDSEEHTVSELEMRECVEHLDRDYNVVIDATNLEPDHVQRWQTLARTRGIDCVVIDVHAPLDTCIARVASRARHGGHDVDEQVIRQVWQEHPPGTWLPPADYVVGEGTAHASLPAPPTPQPPTAPPSEQTTR